MAAVIDFVDARDALLVARLAARKATRNAAPIRTLHPRRDALPPALLRALQERFGDVAPGRNGWTVADGAGRLLRIEVRETTPGVFDWTAFEAALQPSA